MNRHFINTDKFFNAYIDDIYALGLEAENEIYVLANQENRPGHLTTDNPFLYVENDVDSILKVISTFQPEDKIFVCWYSGPIAEAIVKSGIKNPLYVYLMGGDFYVDPIEWHVDWLFDKLTRRKIKKAYFPQVKWTRKNPLHWYRIKTDLVKAHQHKVQVKKAYQKKLKEIERIDYIVLPIQDVAEIDLVKRLYPTCHAKHVYGLFDQNFDMASQLCTKSRSEGKWRILFGNSADPTNNYIDGFKYLSKVLPDVEVFTILSYGDENGKKWALEAGEKTFGDDFHPIMDFMPRACYLDFLMDKDAVVMFHNRPQAVGNIMTALVLGKPVFIKKSNAIYDFLKSIGGLPVYDVVDLKKVSLESCINEALKKRENTIKAVEGIYSNRLRLELLKKMLRLE